MNKTQAAQITNIIQSATRYKKDLHWSMIGKILLHTGENLMGLGLAIRVGTFPVQPLLCAWPDLGTQPCYKTPGNLRVKIAEKQWLKSGDWGCSPDNGPKMAVGQPNGS